MDTKKAIDICQQEIKTHQAIAAFIRRNQSWLSEVDGKYSYPVSGSHLWIDAPYNPDAIQAIHDKLVAAGLVRSHHVDCPGGNRTIIYQGEGFEVRIVARPDMPGSVCTVTKVGERVTPIYRVECGDLAEV